MALHGGCIGDRPFNPAATQPATAVDVATTQPSYWLSQPAAAGIRTGEFETAWETCKSLARDYLFEIDRTDYRAGLITTKPLVSRQFVEFWRPDTGSADQVWANSVSTIRRTIRFEFVREADGRYAVSPRVIVERESILERRLTSVAQYRQIFQGPRTTPRYTVQSEVENQPELPVKYWFIIGRDTEMETQIARKLGDRLAIAPAGAIQGTKVVPVTQPTVKPAGMNPDGAIASVGQGQTVYINLGAADKVVSGMTFEVYDAKASIPTAEKYAAVNAGSKGWIEVLTVANSSSVCRVLQATGTLNKGDLIHNFVFDRARPNHFALTGQFTGGRETLAGLIWRWYGVVDDTVAPSTHFLIVGAAPTQAAAKREHEDIISKATERGIPILSEERFNLLIRHYDPSKR